MKEDGQTMSTVLRRRRIHSAHARHEALRGVSCRQALCSMTFPDSRPPLTSIHLEPPSTACPYFGTVYSNWPSCEEPAIGRCTYGVNTSPVPLLKAFESQIIDPPKTLQPHPALISTSTQSNARHDPKNRQARRRP